MAFQLIILAAIVAIAHAAAIAPAKLVDEDFDPNPQYTFSYDVQDPTTGDSKGQTETRDGDVVHGSYNVMQPDGVRRIVEYTADPVNGFTAVVRHEGEPKAVVAKVAAPVAVARPVAVSQPVAVASQPVAVAQPITVSHPVAVATHQVHQVAVAHHPVTYAHHPFTHPVAVAHHTVAHPVAVAHPVTYTAHHPIAFAASHPVLYSTAIHH